MASIQYITTNETDFSQGIDARSAENQIAPGFVKDLLNGDIVEKRPRTRTGYQGYAGNLPVRVTGLEYDDAANQICFTLDSAVSLDTTSVDLNSLRSTPIVVYGRSSNTASGGPFTTSGDSVRYYAGFTIPTRKTFIATAGLPLETISIPEAEHGIPTTNLFAATVESTSTTNRSYQTALPHEISVAESTADITISYQNSTGTDRDVYAYYMDESPVVGQVHIEMLSHTGSGSESFSIPAATHALVNFNIVSMIQEDTGTDRVFVQPESFTLANNGDVTIVLNSSAATTYYAILTAAPIANQTTGNVPGNTTSTVQITGLTSPWLFPAIYLELTPGGDKQIVIPDLIEFDDSTATLTLTFTNSIASARNFVVFYSYGTIRSNQLCVSDSSISVDAIDPSPQLTIWGLDHTEIYGTNGGREGWVNHIDSYRSAGDNRVVSGLGGNLFTAESFAEVGSGYDYMFLHPNLQARTSSATVLGPVFWDTEDTPARTRGYVTTDTGGTGWVQVTSVSYDSGTGYTEYVLSVPNKQVLDSTGTPTSLSAVISTTTQLEDWFTVSNMSYARHNGTFRIQQIVDGVNQITLLVENAAVSSSDWDDANTIGQGGIFTDRMTWLTATPFISGDVLASAAFSDSQILTVLSGTGMSNVISGITERISVAGGILSTGGRTSSVIPLRSSQPASLSSTNNAIRGDMLSYLTGDASWDGRQLRVLYVNPEDDDTVTVDGDGITATVTLGSLTTTFLIEGHSVLLLDAGEFTGSWEVQSILDTSSFTISSSATGTAVSGILVGNTIEIDEAFEWADTTDDSNGLVTTARWIPIEAPDDSYDLTPSTHPRYFDANSYSDQPFLRSTMVQNGLYLTDGGDEVMKFDGTHNYRAGLFPWQPGLFVTQDTSATGKIVLGNRSLAYSAISASGGYVTIDSADQLVLEAGVSVRLSGSTETYTIRSVVEDSTTPITSYLYMDRALDGSVSATGTVSEIAIFRYYFRLNAIDANDNIVASAVTGAEDHVVELSANAAVYLKLVGLPAWDIYDYVRLEVEIYRTKQSTAAPFYRVTTLQMDFDNTQGYVTYVDSFSDSDLIELDAVSTALKGQELGTAWQEPLRADYVTSIGNSLILAGIKDYPQLDLQLIANGTVDNSTFDGKLFTFRRDSTDTAATTDNTNVVRFELVDGTTTTAGSFVVGTDDFTFTAGAVPGGLATGDWLYLSYSTVATTARDLTYSGWYQVASVAGSDVTVNLVGAAAASSYPDACTFATDTRDVPVLLGTDGNLGMVNGDSFDLFDVGRRLAMAINTSQRMVDVSLVTDFTPWLTARGGNDVGKAGRVVIRQPRADTLTPSLVLPASFSGGGNSFDVFVNDIRRTTSASIAAVTRIYKSRILASYENYPEIFDTPTAVLDTESDSAIDINPADGQDLTGVVPFFGEAAFTAAQQAAILVAFKTNSIYLVDLNEKRNGRNAVQRIETEGLGCTAPYSIAVTKRGIIFANESGIYCLRRDQSIQYVGRYMERNWTERVDLDQLALCQGHHYGVGRVYKLSVPLSGDTANSEVYVYNHTAEEEGKLGAWTRYDDHPATGWANLAADAFFGSTLGRVFSLRNRGTETDYRDDSSPITFRLDTRALDFGNPGIRKVVDSLVVNYRTKAPTTTAVFSYAMDLSTEYTATATINLPRSSASTGIGDVPPADILPIRHDTQRRRGLYFQGRVECSVLDEPIEVSGISVRVGGLSDRGVRQAAQTK